MTIIEIAPASAPPTLARVASVTLRGWSGLDRTYDLDGASALISGANGAGKTALVDALRFAVAGTSRRGKRPEDVWRHARSEATEIAVTVELAGLSWTRGINREGDKLVGYLEIAGKPRLKIREAEALLAAELRALPAQFGLAGYHDLSPAAKRDFLLVLLGVANVGGLAGRVARYAQVAALPPALTRLIGGRDSSADLLALLYGAKDAVNACVTAAREATSAARALQDQQMSMPAGTACQAEEDQELAREARIDAASALAAAREREEFYQWAAKAEADARQALAVLQAAAEERTLFDDSSDVDRLRAALAEAQSTLDQTRRAEEAERDSLRDLDAQADAACLDLRAKEARASETKIASDAKKAVYLAAARAEIESKAALETLEKRIEALEHGPAAEALACYSAAVHGDIDWVRLGELIRAWAAVAELEQARDRAVNALDQAKKAEQAAESAEGQADIWSDTAADAELERKEAEVTTAQAAEARSAAALRLRDLVLETIAAEASIATARGNLDAISVGQDDPGRDLALAAARHAEALAALDACPALARPLAEFAAQALAAAESEKSAQDHSRAHQEARGRAKHLAGAVALVASAEAETMVAKSILAAVQSVREEVMAEVIAPLTEAMRPILIDAWPPAPGCHAVSVYAELETLHGHAAAELGIVVLGADDRRYRVSYETMSGAQAAVFDAALLAALIARGSRLAVLPLELDAMAPSTASMLLCALAEHAPAVQVLASTWQGIAPPSGWKVVEV